MISTNLRLLSTLLTLLVTSASFAGSRSASNARSTPNAAATPAAKSATDTSAPSATATAETSLTAAPAVPAATPTPASESERRTSPYRVGMGLLILEKGTAYFDSRLSSGDKVEFTEKNSVSGFNLMLKYEPQETFGWNAQAGFNLQGNVHINTTELTGENLESRLSKSNVYAMIGYKLWKFGVYLGVQHPISGTSSMTDYEIKPQLGGRAEIGIDIGRYLNVAGYLGWNTYKFQNTDPFSSLGDKYVDVGSTGIIVRLMTY